MGRRSRIAGFAIAVTALGYIGLWPVPFDPAPWTPPPASAHPVNDRLAKATRVGAELAGPEALAFDAKGRLHTGLVDGRIVRLDAEGKPHELVNTGGRPLGMKFDPSGRLIVADGVKGLLAVTDKGEVSVLATEHEGKPFGFTDDLDVAKDGTIYFSDASSRFGAHDYRNDALEHRPNGRLLRLTPDGRTELVKGDMYFANGVALSPDESFVLVTETWEYRVTRVWLTGPKAGTHDEFASNLPGFPDNITRRPDGSGYWLALFAPRNPTLDRLAGKPFLRKVIARLPMFLQPKPARHAFVLGLDGEGKISQDLQHLGEDSFSPITSALEHDGKLWLGSLSRDTVAWLPVP